MATGTIVRILDNHAILRDEFGVDYFMYRTNLARFHSVAGVETFADLKPGMDVEFTPVDAVRRKDHPSALDVRVTGLGLDGL